MKKYILSKDNVINFIFFFAYALVCFNFMSSSVLFIKNYHNVIIYISLFMLISVFALQSDSYQKKSLLYIFIASLLGFISYAFSGDNTFILIVLLVACSKKIDFNKIVKFDLIIKILFVFLILILYKLGGTEYITRYRDDGTLRLAMGFGHPNVFAAYLFFICLDISYLNYKKMNLFWYLIIIICLYVSHFVCNSRSAEISLSLLLFFSFFHNFTEKKLFSKKIIRFMPFLIFAISLIFTKLYLDNNSFMIYFDKLLNKRFFYSAMVSKYVGFSWFGANFSNIVKFGLDNAYLNTYYQYGVFSAFFLLYCIFKVICYSQNNKDYKAIMCIFIYLIYAFIEKYSFHIEYNVFLFSISCLIFLKLNNNNERIEKDD